MLLSCTSGWKIKKIKLKKKKKNGRPLPAGLEVWRTTKQLFFWALGANITLWGFSLPADAWVSLQGGWCSTWDSVIVYRHHLFRCLLFSYRLLVNGHHGHLLLKAHQTSHYNMSRINTDHDVSLTPRGHRLLSSNMLLLYLLVYTLCAYHRTTHQCHCGSQDGAKYNKHLPLCSVTLECIAVIGATQKWIKWLRLLFDHASENIGVYEKYAQFIRFHRNKLLHDYIKVGKVLNRQYRHQLVNPPPPLCFFSSWHWHSTHILHCQEEGNWSIVYVHETDHIHIPTRAM